MEYAVYKIFFDNEHKKGSFVNMLPTREEAEAFAARLKGAHDVVGLWTREISEEDEYLWDTVAFDEGGVVRPVGEAPPDA